MLAQAATGKTHLQVTRNVGSSQDTSGRREENGKQAKEGAVRSTPVGHEVLGKDFGWGGSRGGAFWAFQPPSSWLKHRGAGWRQMLAAGDPRGDGRNGSSEGSTFPRQTPPSTKSQAPATRLDPLSVTPARHGPTSVAEEALRLLLGSSRDHRPHQVVYEGNQDDQEKQYLCLPEQKEPAGESGKRALGETSPGFGEPQASSAPRRAAGTALASPRERGERKKRAVPWPPTPCRPGRCPAAPSR